MENLEKDLRNRFVVDNNLPIQVIDSPYFEYFLDLYEETWKSKSLWEEFKDEVNDFGGPGKFLDEYYRVKNSLITDIKESESYQDFIGDPNFSSTTYKTPPSGPKGKLYTRDKKGKRFYSIDLRQANFQALKFYNPEIVKNSNAWEELVGKYTSSKHIGKSKHLRQVVLGNLNPGRQILMEMYLMGEIKDNINLSYPEFSRNNDELIYDVTNQDILVEPEYVKNLVNQKLGLDVKVGVFEIDLVERFTNQGKSVLGFLKKFDTGVETIHGVERLYYPQIYKAWKGLDVNPSMDLVFSHEGNLAHFDYQLSEFRKP